MIMTNKRVMPERPSLGSHAKFSSVDGQSLWGSAMSNAIAIATAKYETELTIAIAQNNADKTGAGRKPMTVEVLPANRGVVVDTLFDQFICVMSPGKKKAFVAKM